MSPLLKKKAFIQHILALGKKKTVAVKKKSCLRSKLIACKPHPRLNNLPVFSSRIAKPKGKKAAASAEVISPITFSLVRHETSPVPQGM